MRSALPLSIACSLFALSMAGVAFHTSQALARWNGTEVHHAD